MKRMLFVSLMLGYCSIASSAEVIVTQNDKQFSDETLTIKVGDEIKFVNEDSVAHNIFSLSDAKSFDLGTFENGAERAVKFDEAGTIEIECALHPDMYLEVTVE